MRYRLLGRTGVRVSELCLGTMTFGNEADETTARQIMDRAMDAGINFFDTADVYSKGKCEEFIGRWLPERRHGIVLATKVHYPTGSGPNERGSSRLHIAHGVEASLRRLQTDYVDILYLHSWDDKTDVAESLEAISNLIDQGKVLYLGVSNFAAWQTMKAIGVTRERLFAPVSVIQPMYNLVKRQAEVEILPMAEDQGLGVCPYSPLGAGILTGKYHRKEKGRIDVNPMYRERYRDPVYMEVAERFTEHAATLGYPPAALAVAWVLGHPTVTSAIIGARNLDQLESSLASQDITLAAEQRDEISGLSVSPPRATDRESDEFLPFPKAVEERDT